MTPARKRLLAVIIPIQVFLAALAWRDIGRRSRAQVRGRKNVWRAVVLLNPGNSILYWLFGRRGTGSR